MLVHPIAGKRRSYQLVAMLVLVLVPLAMSAHVVHFHSHSDRTSTTRCTFCEIGETPLPVLVISPVTTHHPTAIVETVSVSDSPEAEEGSNLFVRPPPVWERR